MEQLKRGLQLWTLRASVVLMDDKPCVMIGDVPESFDEGKLKQLSGLIQELFMTEVNEYVRGTQHGKP